MKDVSHDVSFVPSDYGFSESTYNFANLDERQRVALSQSFSGRMETRLTHWSFAHPRLSRMATSR